MKNFDAKLQKLAEVAVRVGLNVQPGQEVVLSANLEDAPLVRKFVAEAYKAGAKNVAVLYGDDANTLARFQYGSEAALNYAPQWLIDGMARAYEEGAARMAIYGDNPALLKDVDPEKVALSSKVGAKASERVMELITGFHVNWSIISCASAAWAKLVFPGEPEEVAVGKLWDAIFKVSRVDAPDPVVAWKAHDETLHAHARGLNERRYAAVHFRGPGTDLRVGLADGHVWVGGGGTAKNGAYCVPNIPTEEVFTMPHRDQVEGTVSATKPLSLRGRVLEGIQVRFEGGKVVEAKASKGQEVLEKLLDTDGGARRLGEVALVPHSSPVSQTGILFFNTLFDENAASHIALGRSYEENLAGFGAMSEEERAARGYNNSLTHVDWMIGSDKVDVDGITASGQAEPLMRGGEWVND